MADRDAKGRNKIPLGSAHGQAKITEAVAYRVKELRAEGLTCKRIAIDLGLKKSHVKDIAGGRTWKHIAFPSPPSQGSGE